MFKIEIDRDVDGHWIVDIPQLPGVLTYGATEAEAWRKAIVLALEVISDSIVHGEPIPIEVARLFEAASKKSLDLLDTTDLCN